MFDVGTNLEFVADSVAMRRTLAKARRLVAHDGPVVVLGEPGSGRRRLLRWVLEQKCLDGEQVLIAPAEIDRGWSSWEATWRQRREDARGGALVVADIDRVTSSKVADLESWLRSADAQIGVTTRSPLSRGEWPWFATAATVTLPPLRARGRDLPVLADALLARACRKVGAHALGFTSDALDALLAYDWPGNVAELAEVMTGAALVARRRATLELEDLPGRVKDAHRGSLAGGIATLAEMERRTILSTLRRFDGRRGVAARALGVSPRTIARKLAAYGVDKGALGPTRNE